MTLETCFQAMDQTTTSKKRATVKLVQVNRILFWRYRNAERWDFKQLVVRKKLQSTVMKMAHEGLLTLDIRGKAGL